MLLVAGGETGFGIGRRDEHHTADCCIDDVDQAEILQVGKRGILVLEGLLGKDQDVRVGAIGAPAPQVRRPVHIRSSFGIAVEYRMRLEGPLAGSL